MKRRMTFLACILLALCLFPSLAAAAETVQATAPAQGCDGMSSLAASATPAMSTPAVNPFAGVIEAQGGCCFGKLVACNAVCVCGVFEFNCDPATCQSSCICNICP